MISPTRRLQRNDGRPLAMLSRRRSRAASRTTSWPRTRTLPESGVSRVARIDRSVVFPAPLGPSSPTMVPRGTVSDTPRSAAVRVGRSHPDLKVFVTSRSEEHTSELQSHHDLVCRLLLEKKKKITKKSLAHIPLFTTLSTML